MAIAMSVALIDAMNGVMTDAMTAVMTGTVIAKARHADLAPSGRRRQLDICRVDRLWNLPRGLSGEAPTPHKSQKGTELVPFLFIGR
jgi:hypothetical protein